MKVVMHAILGQDLGDRLDAVTSARLSTRLRQARQMRNMTLKLLADAADCSESLLSKIENGKACPSLPMLNRLVKALAVGMGWLFDDQDGKKPIIFRVGQRGTLPTAGRPVTVERVIPDSDGHALRCNILHVEAGAASEGEHQHVGEAVGYLIDGQLELRIAGCPYQLDVGDAFAFHSEQPYAFRNTGATSASVFWVSTPPLV